MDEATYKASLETIYTHCVGKAIANLEINKVPHAPAPEIHPSETLLARKTRTTLAQLRSGYSTTLNSFLHRIKPALYTTDSCPKCGQSPHTTAHLFNCPADPADVTIPWQQLASWGCRQPRNPRWTTTTEGRATTTTTTSTRYTMEALALSSMPEAEEAAAETTKGPWLPQLFALLPAPDVQK